MKEELTVDVREAGSRLDVFMANRVTGLSRTRAQQIIAGGGVKVNGTLCRNKKKKVEHAELIEVEFSPPEPYTLEPEPIFLDIIYEDKDLLVINKPAGMVVHPAPGHSHGTLVHALLYHCKDLSGIGGVMRPGIVHRLDKDTTGLMVAAKNDYSHRELSAQLKERRLRREYMALVHGSLEPAAGKINAPIGRHPGNRKRMAVVTGGRSAVTRYRVIVYTDSFTLVKVSLETGRTHQVRVHMAFLGHPVAGDPVYGPDVDASKFPELACGQILHARRIVFQHPRTGTLMEFTAPLPENFRRLIVRLRNK